MEKRDLSKASDQGTHGDTYESIHKPVYGIEEFPIGQTLAVIAEASLYDILQSNSEGISVAVYSSSRDIAQYSCSGDAEIDAGKVRHSGSTARDGDVAGVGVGLCGSKVDEGVRDFPEDEGNQWEGSSVSNGGYGTKGHEEDVECSGIAELEEGRGHLLISRC